MIPKSVEVGPSKTDIQLSYEDGRTLLISSVFLRKFSPSAENKKNLMDDKIKQFQGVLINKIDLLGIMLLGYILMMDITLAFIVGITY